MRCAAALAIITALALARPSGAQPRRFDIVDSSGTVEVTVIPTPPAQRQDFFTAAPLAYSSTMTISQLAQIYTEAFRPEEKNTILKVLSGKTPRDELDIRALLNLYHRYQRRVRHPVQLSISRLAPQDEHFAPFFTALLEEEEPSFQAFGLLGTLQVRNKAALPQIRRLAERRLDKPEAPNEVAITLQALQVLAELRAPKTRRLVLRHTRVLPATAEILAHYYWKESLPLFVRWAESNNEYSRARARAAWRTDVPTDALRETVEKLRALVLSRRRAEFTRHHAAIKLGFAADDAEVVRLLRDHAQAGDEQTRLYLTAALFASRSPRVIPLLVEHAKTHESPINRAGALGELKDLMPRDDYVALLTWFTANDPDPENQRIARLELRALDVPAAP
ncbi:MAG: hypothetical protein ABIJ96_18455 [Elusimicrobiota bacterium]